ncbi:hypothetical protein [Kaistia terrae]|uniref:Uncharacterized protein n=1 Tax=Kaistia terrae TaxID=537017 RepID=A0ABW0PZW5_9HYPH|nr:hypothetical protein [Kaistia terrae]MCX5580509.1 hypothetical protein [Kaistia terrae]
MSSDEHEGAGRAAVLRRFPAEHRAIEALTAQNEDFRDMCEELAEAEMALLAVERLPGHLRSQRAAEWRASIERLASEIARALNDANVIHIDWPGHSKRRP